MKKIVILGSSLSSIKALEELKVLGVSFEAEIISSENTLPYFRHLLPEFLAKKVLHNKVHYRSAAQYEAEHIRFVFDKKVSRVNFKRGRITLEDKETLNYDFLFLGDLYPQNFVNVKGANKGGIYNLKRFGDAASFLKASPLIETVVIESNCLAGFKAALALCESKKKEVILVTADTTLLGGLLAQSDVASLQDVVAQTGLRLVTENKITELLGDQDVKAIRLKSGKVLACQAVLTDNDLPDLRLFKDTELKLDVRVMTNESYQTNFENVFAFESVCDRINLSDFDVSDEWPLLAQEQGRTVAAQIMGQEYIPVSGPSSWTVEINANLLKFLATPGQPIIQLQREQMVVGA